ncbi:MAG: mechanosensitive ion channel family protein [Thermoplasmata archaeon]|nr:mechanosensitive ion channel family protein [Thermoplasmata archaeon]
MNRSRNAALALLAMALLLSLVALSTLAAAQGIVFREVGPFEQECPASESIYYQWFVYNDDLAPYLVEVSVSEFSGSGWRSVLDRPIFVLDPGAGIFVNLTVTASSDVSSKRVNQTVQFSFTDLQDTAHTFEVTSVAQTEFIPTWDVIAPGKNKILGYFDNPLPPPFDGNYTTFALNVLIWIGIGLVVAYVVAPAVRVFTKKTKTDIDDRVLKVIHMPVFALIIVYGLVSSLSILQLSDSQVNLILDSYGIVLIVVATYVVYKIFKEVLVHIGKKWSARTKSEIDDVLIPVIDKIGGVVILVFGAVGLLNYMGYDITFLLAGVGVLGLVIAFAAQDFLSNFFSGVFILLDRPFSEGQFIQIATGETCRVDKIGIRSTRLYNTFQNNYVVLPNNKLVNDKIVNLTEPDARGVSEIVVKVAPTSDTDKVERVLLEIVKAHPEVLKSDGKAPAVRLVNLADGVFEFKVFFWVEDFMTSWRVAHEIRKETVRRFSEERIDIAMPQTAILMKQTAK